MQKLEANKNAFGIFGYSFLEENTAKLKGVAIEGVEPTYDTISSGKYKGARPLFVYVKKQHIGVIPGLDKFVGRVRVRQGARQGRIPGAQGPRRPAEGRAREGRRPCSTAMKVLVARRRALSRTESPQRLPAARAARAAASRPGLRLGLTSS